MKRIALLAVLLLVVGLTAGFAIDVKPEVTLSGTATLTWAYDLDTGFHGFKNAADGAFRLSLLAEDGTDTHKGTGDAYGSITFANLEFFWVIDSAPLALTAGPADADITAKIVVTPFEIGITTAPGFTQDFFGAIEDADVPDRVVENSETAYAMPGSSFTTPYGTWVTGTFGPAAVTLKVVSDGDWTANSNNYYAFGGEAVLTFTPLTVSAGAYMGAQTSAYAKVALDMAPIVAWGGFEATLASTMTYGAGAGLTFTLVKDTTLAATMWYGDGYHGLDLQVVFTEPGDAGLVPMLDTTVTFNLLDVGGTLASEYEAILALGYKVGLNSDNSQYARPFLNFTYGSNANDGVSDITPVESVMYATAGVQLQVIPLTLFTVQWVSGSTTGNDLASTTMSLGTVQFVATVTY
jgi:hypothetical protein